MTDSWNIEAINLLRETNQELVSQLELVSIERNELRAEVKRLHIRQAAWGGPDGPIAQLISETGCDCDTENPVEPGDHDCTAGQAEAEWCALRARVAAVCPKCKGNSRVKIGCHDECQNEFTHYHTQPCPTCAPFGGYGAIWEEKI